MISLVLFEAPAGLPRSRWRRSAALIDDELHLIRHIYDQIHLIRRIYDGLHLIQTICDGLHRIRHVFFDGLAGLLRNL